MKTGRNLFIQIGSLLLALPILYVISSGPVIRYSSIALSTDTKVVHHPDSPSVASRPLTPQDYFKKIEALPVDSQPIRVNYAAEFYRPLVRIADRLHLETPLSAYLHIWRIFVIHTGVGHHFFFIVLNE